MLKHTITIVFGSDEGATDIETLVRHLGEEVLAAKGYGVEIDHSRQWLEDGTTITGAYVEPGPRPVGEPDYSRDHVS